ncbi:MAG TPA: cadherin-like domain-containing protein [Accumulibacter sp.]|uniref:cadherin-like domain-containing protein n=1 Tax=Accumulibacter sp. TaxID=2053492 RepID=UPI002BC072AB|nr:cadherin-like domain-containing protein [Accumulibacter sp.]HMV04935.1 cadherin-like domain-containing protein [Accumulibacter sp.]
MRSDDAMLVLDRNYNGQYDSGRELFANGNVALSRRGLAGMAWVDANYDGKLTAADPVWSELKAWRDLDQDGQQDAGEVVGLAALDVSELNYAMGTLTRSGVKQQLASPDLQADREGSRVSVVPEGILVQASEDGHLSLLVTRVDDNTAVEANRDGIAGYEDVEIIVSSADLLANDTLGGIPGRNLTITGVTHFRHGTGFLDANGFVHFTPEANYAGDAAGFDYVAQAAGGQTGTSTVDITVQNVNDAPTLDHVEHTTRAVYGYTPIVYSTDEEFNRGGQYVSGGNPIYVPYAVLRTTDLNDRVIEIIVYDPAPGQWNYEYHTTPIANEDSGGGRVAGTDVDDPPSSLSYEIVNQPQYGSVDLNADGSFQYTSWKEPGIASDRIVYDGQYAGTKNGTLYHAGNLPSEAVYPTTDVFQVRITDAQGASTLQSISVPHYGPYLPPTPPGGGGGKKPIAVDLNGNGFEFVNVDDTNVFFDVNGDGWKRRTSWVGKDDGLLAYDIDGDGRIDQAGEISFARYQPGAQTDLEGLQAFDSSDNGRFDAADDKWAKFGVWQDVNQNGVTDPGEFRSLSAMGITAVDLTSDAHFQVINGQTVHGLGQMTKADGSTLAIADVTLAYSQQTQVPQGDGTTPTANPPPFSPNGEEIVGSEGKDLILGKNGNNIVKGLGGDDVVFEDGGNDIVDGGDGNDLIYSGADNDLVMGGAGNDALYTGLGNDLAFGGDGHDAIFAEGGNDVVFAGAGNDLISGGWGNDVLSGDDGNDQVYGESGNDALFGRDGDDELYGLQDNDRLDGGKGKDLLDGGAGSDTLIGGADDDTYVVDDASDTVTEWANEGQDSVRTTLDDYTLGAHLENLSLAGSANLTGHGNQASNVLVGNRGNNTLTGDAGNDTLDGALGTDTLIGGSGDDTYRVDNAGDTLLEQADEGSDTVKASVSYALAAHLEHLILTGDDAIDATGNELDNRLTGNAGDNRLDGGAGADLLAGGRGNDTYVVDQTGDSVSENAAEGIDTVLSAIDYHLGANLENLTLSTTSDIHGTGNELDNLIVGNAGNNTLDGGSGADTLAGGAGDDTYRVDNAGDTLLEQADEGSDTVKASVSYALAAHLEHLILTGDDAIDATGNELDNRLTGNAGDNRLDGGAGADLLAGGRGNDTYVVDQTGDSVSENAAEGIDTVLSAIDYHLGANLEHLTLSTTSDLNGSGNELDNLIVGNAGNNTLDGGSGADTLAGGLGDDSYLVDNAGDSLSEAADAGTDAVFASVSYTLSANLEHLTLTGSDDLSARGNDLSNVLTGNTGANRLDGGAGADALLGGAGDDTYLVDDLGDMVREFFAEGTDSVLAALSFVLPEHVENLTLTGDAAIDATGNALDNTLIGNSGSNRLDGGLGADAMFGGSGDDTYRVDHALDSVTENAQEGSDTVFANVSHTLSAHVENLTLTGSADLDATGNELANTLIGNSGRNLLNGATGADSMAGGAGNDDYFVDNAGDTVSEAFNDGIDTIYASVAYVLPEHVENLILTGNGNLDASGNGADNTLTGNAGDNALAGGGGNDTLEGGQGNDVLIGGSGNDTYLFKLGDGLDTINDVSGTDTVRFATGLSLDNVALRITETNGVHTAQLRILNAGGCEQADQGFDFTVTVDRRGQITSPIEKFQFADGSPKTLDDLRIKTRFTYGTPWTTTLTTGRDDDIIVAGPRQNLIRSGSGNDIVYACSGGDTVQGEGGNDYLQGGSGNDTLDGGCGLDVLAGSNGRDTLRDLGGINALFGGTQNDQIEAGAGNDFIAGGRHDDTIQAGGGKNIMAFNWGDGRDIVLPSLGAANTLSLGGGIEESDLVFKKTGSDLVLGTGGSHQITLKDWYASTGNQSVDRVQVVEAVPYFGFAQTRPTGWQVDIYDFKALVQQFDAARTANPKLSQWRLMNGLLDAHLSRSASAALGGELATRYALGSESAISLAIAQETLKDPHFGSQAQAVGHRFDATVCAYRLA